MSLEECKECGSKVSTDATSCPSCGARRIEMPKQCTGFSFLLLAISAARIILVWMSDMTTVFGTPATGTKVKLTIVPICALIFAAIALYRSISVSGAFSAGDHQLALNYSVTASRFMKTSAAVLIIYLVIDVMGLIAA